MPRAPTASDAQVAVAGLVGGGIAYADLVGRDVAPTHVWGHVSMFSFAQIIALLVPAVALVVVRGRPSAGRALRGAWPVLVRTAAITALASAVLARVIDDGGILALAAAVAGSAALLLGTSRARAERGTWPPLPRILQWNRSR